MIKIEAILRKPGPKDSTRVSILTEGKWASYLEFDENGPTVGWSKGDEVDVHIIEKNGFFNLVLGASTPKNEQKPAKSETFHPNPSPSILLLESILMELKSIRAVLEVKNG